MADRTDFDLKAHQTTSGKSMEYLNPTTGEKIIPYVIEPSLGADRAGAGLPLRGLRGAGAAMGGDTRVVMHFHPALAPYKCAVLPLQKNKCGEKAGEIHDMLSKHFMVDYDESRLHRQALSPSGRDRHADAASPSISTR